MDAPVSASASFTAFSSAVALTDGLTVVRIRGTASMWLTGVAGADGDGYRGASGLCKITEEQVAVGITAIPLPFDDDGWDGWMWHSYWDIHTSDISAGDVDHPTVDLVIDTKAMRKIAESESIALGPTDHAVFRLTE